MQIIENFLSQELWQALRQFSRQTKLVNTNITQWQGAVVGRSSPIIQQTVSGWLLEKVQAELGKHVEREYRRAQWKTTIHLGSYLSYIPWHNDSTYKLSITAYLHEHWELEHAGYFMWEEPDGIRSVVPWPNMGLVYETPLMHSVALANINAPLRESLQIFIGDV